MASRKPSPRLTHFALFVEDLARMRDFYTGVMGLTVTDQGSFPDPDVPVDMVFMSNDPAEHHQFVLVTGRPGDVPFALNQQLSFVVSDLDELRAIRDAAAGANAGEIWERSHGNAWSVYFHDPEQNLIEIYVHTPWHVPQPHRTDLDLDQSNDEIYRATEAHCRSNTGFMTAAEREAEMAGMMASSR
jgi:catechol 2,3-dioxygenase